MPEVYIDSLTLDNFGPFYGEHTLDFRSLEGKYCACIYSTSLLPPMSGLFERRCKR